MKKLYSNKLVIFSLILPGLLLFIFAILAPICLSVYYGFTDYSGMGKYNMIGIENYKNLLHDKVFAISLRNSLFLAIGFICIQHPIAMIIAAVLDKIGGRAESIFRCIYFIPNVISIAVIAKLWSFIYNPNFGLLNNIIKAMGGKGNINWLDEKNAIWSVLLVLIWHGFGWGMLIYYTGIKNIDPTLYEAASIDGASQVQTFLRVTLPLMKPVIQVNVTMAVISALKQMETVYLLTQGGPGNSTQFAANYLYQQGFTAYRYGYGNAIGVIFIIICLIATVALNKVFEDREEAKYRKMERKRDKKNAMQKRMMQNNYKNSVKAVS
ncbi:MAG: sugar ABC transporter permease [Lachnospiraceae bacterium]|nr:sugar ABC transporter permease [Lachnospiraceae bacterium]